MMRSVFDRAMAFLCALAAEWGAFAGDADGKGDLLDRLVAHPPLAGVALSMDGHYVSAFVAHGEDQRLVVARVDSLVQDEIHPHGGPEAAAARTDLGLDREDVRWMAWVGGGRLLLAGKDYGLRVYDAHTASLSDLIDLEDPEGEALLPSLLTPLPDDPRHALLQWSDAEKPSYPAVYRLNVVTGAARKVTGAWQPVVRWWASPEGEVALGEAYVGREHRLYGRSSEPDGAVSGWRLLRKGDVFDDPAFVPLTVEAGGATVTMLSGHAGDTRTLWRVSARTGEPLLQLASHERYDIAAAISDPVSDLVVGATLDEDGPRDILWQEDIAALNERIAKALGVDRVRLVTASRDGMRWLVRVPAPDTWPAYYIFDRDGDRLLRLSQPAVYAKAGTRSVWIPLKSRRSARRGDLMHGLLSLPREGPSGRGVILIHGGPVSRVRLGYQPLVTWLTANGYAVLQPNFRGSSGFGDAWRRAGYGEWGGRMQKDIAVAARWMIAEGHVKSGLLCAMGGSYGGYAALMAVIRQERFFECAVSLNGVTLISGLIAYLETQRFHALSVPRIRGRLNPWKMAWRSPLHRAKDIERPVLLLHATQDANVPFAHSRQLADTLTELKKPHEFIALQGAEHVLRKPSYRRTYYEAAVRFLDRHIGPARFGGRVNGRDGPTS